MRGRSLGVALCVTALLGACGDDENPASSRHDPNGADVPRAGDTTLAGSLAGSRRITAHEYNQILADVLGDTTGWTATHVDDTKTGFDNDTLSQPLIAQAYVEEMELAATQAAKRFVVNDAAYAALVPCTPSGANDAKCFGDVVGKIGRRLLRRTLQADEVGRYVNALQPFAVEKNDFKVGIELVVRTMLQDSEFLHVIQTTRPIAGSTELALTGLSRASALSFFLWGTTPDDALLDKAEQNALDSPTTVAQTAAAMLEDPRAKRQLDRFVAMWFGYEVNPAMTDDLAIEMNKVIERAVFEKDTDVVSLFTSTETYLPNDALADVYGLPHPPAGGGFVPYGDSGRAGILSTGAVLTMGAKAGDSSPTQRGKAVLDKLLCQPLQRPANVNVDQPPAAPDNSPCKVARYKAIAASNVACSTCHERLDGVGLGLEGYDLKGHFRTHDDAHEECAIPGEGNLPGVGTFKGPGELGSILAKSGKLDACIVRQAYRYGLARSDTPDDEASVTSLTTQFTTDQRSMKKLLVTLVSSSSFLTAKGP